MDFRPKLYSPALKFQNVKFIGKTQQFNARVYSYYWFKNLTDGMQIEFRDDYQVIWFCRFDYTNFPFEALYCNVTFVCSSNDNEHVLLGLPNIRFVDDKKSMAKVNVNSNLPYDITAKSINPFNFEDQGLLYSATGIQFVMERNELGLLMLQFYCPMAVFAILSLLSFSIHIEAVRKFSMDLNIKFKTINFKVPGRMGLVITLCLISFNVYNVVDAPPTRGFSYVEIWMIGMEIPILLAALEYSMILGLKRCLPKVIERHAGKVDAITCFLSVTYILIFSSYYWLCMIPKYSFRI